MKTALFIFVGSYPPGSSRKQPRPQRYRCETPASGKQFRVYSDTRRNQMYRAKYDEVCSGILDVQRSTQTSLMLLLFFVPTDTSGARSTNEHNLKWS